MIDPLLIDGFFLILPHTLACIPHRVFYSLLFAWSPPFFLHTFHITFTLCMHSNFSCLCSHSLYFSFLDFTLVRCMLQSRPVAGSTWSPNPSPTASSLVAGRFQNRIGLPIPNPVCSLARFWFRFAHQFRFAFQFRSHYRPIPFYCQPNLGT